MIGVGIGLVVRLVEPKRLPLVRGWGLVGDRHAGHRGLRRHRRPRRGTRARQHRDRGRRAVPRAARRASASLFVSTAQEEKDAERDANRVADRERILDALRTIDERLAAIEAKLD